MKKVALPLVLLVLALGVAPGVEGAFGEIWRDVPIGSGAPPPRLVSPADGAMLSSNVITFQWENQAPATSYYLQIDDSPDFSSPDYEYSSITAPEQTVSVGSKTWYWRVRQYRQTPGVTFGAWTDWSEVRSFTVQGGEQQSTTSLSLQPSSFEIVSGGSKSLTAVLTSDGSPVVGKTITWSASGGSLSAESTSTNSNGQATVIFTAPETNESLQIQISASFSGDASYAQSSAQSTATVVPQTPQALSEQVLKTMVEIGFENSELMEEGEALENAFSDGFVGGVLNFVGTQAEVGFRHSSVDNILVVEVQPQERIELELSASSGSKSFVLNFSHNFLSSVVKVVVDGDEIAKASSYEDALDPTDENQPEFFVLESTSGLQVLLSIPSFSVHTVELFGPSQPSSEWWIIGAVVVVLLLVLIIAGPRRRAPPPPAQQPPSPQPEQPAPPPPAQQPPSTPLKCPNCGRENSSNAKFCGYCGHRLAGKG